MLTLSSQVRTKTKKQTRAVRKEGFIPGVLYGPRIKTVSVQVPVKDFEKVYAEAGETSLVTLSFPAEAKELQNTVVMIRDVAKHPISRAMLNIDFYQVPMDEKTVVKVPVEYGGDPPAVKDEGGTLVRNLYELEIRAFPMDIPHEIHVDLSGLAHLGDALMLKDIVLPVNVEVLHHDLETVIAYVEAPQVEEEMAPTEEVSVEDIKTEGEEKREERAAEKAAEETEEK